MLRSLRAALFVFTILCAGTSFAQQTPPPQEARQSTQQIGAEARDIQRSKQIKIPEAPQRPEVEEAIEIQGGEELPKKEVYIMQIEFSGNTVISNAEIKKITSKYEKRKVLLSEISQCAKQITALYRQKGYVTSQAYIPPQKILGGRIKINILEGRVGAVKVQGEKHFTAYGVRRMIDLKKGQILKVQKLENSLVRLNRNPDVQGRAVLAPGEEKGETDIVISVKDKFPMHAGHQFDNLGTRSSGRNRQNVIFTHNNLLTLNDRMISRFILSERHDLIGESASYSLPVTARGTTANINFSNVNIHLGGGLTKFEILGRSTTFGPSLSIPMFMTPHWEGDFSTGFDFTTVLTRILAHEDSRDDLRVLRFGPNISEFDKWGRTVFTNEFSQGFSSFLGASDKKDDNSSRPGGGGQFFVYSAGLARYQRFLFDSIVVGRASSQLTEFRLVSSEEYRLGGMETVRGYPEGDYLADKGFNYSVEIRIPPYLIPKDFQIFGQKPHEAFQLVGFFDYGRAWTNHSLQGPGELHTKTLMGVGGGILIDLFSHLTARLYFAEPVGDGPSDHGRFRVHFILSTEF